MIPNLSAADFEPLWPAAILSVGAILILMAEVFQAAATRRGYQAVIAVAFATSAGAFAVNSAFSPARLVFGGFAVQDPFSSAISAVVCLAVALSLLLAAGFLRYRNAVRGEFYALMLFAGAGMSLLAISNELITLFINLEVVSICTYALTSYLRRGSRPSEAGFKYFILGAFSAAVFLYGASLLYGATGTTHLSELPTRLPDALAESPGLLYAAAGLMAVGFCFKVAAVPFHMWTPDVYEGAPTPVSALMSAGVKAAAFAAFIRVFLPFAEVAGARSASHSELMTSAFAALALLTMVLGNLLALPQRNVKRMLAYSSVAHAGYLLLGVTALVARPGLEIGGGLFSAKPLLAGSMGITQAAALKGILFYLLAYTVTSLGAFGTLAALERRDDENSGTTWDLERFSGLSQRRPGWALAMAACLLSLGGIPPTVGFVGKLLVFQSAVNAGLPWLAVAGILSSVAGVYYYLRVVVYMYMRPSTEEGAIPERQWPTELALILSTASVVLLGIAPGPVSRWMEQAGLVFLGQ